MSYLGDSHHANVHRPTQPWTYLKDSVISVFPHESQEINPPWVHELIIGGSCDATRCFRDTRNHTLTVDLHKQAHIHWENRWSSYFEMLFTQKLLENCSNDYRKTESNTELHFEVERLKQYFPVNIGYNKGGPSPINENLDAIFCL